MKIPVIATLLVLTILGCKGEVDADTSISDSAFRNAVRNGKVEQLDRYLEDGYGINRLGVGGENALQEGILHHDVAKLLIDRGIKVDQRHKFDGTTPLIVACIAGNVEIRTVKLLLESGADPLIKDVQGKNAIDYASENAGRFPDPKHGFTQKLELLQAAKAKKEKRQNKAEMATPRKPSD